MIKISVTQILSESYFYCRYRKEGTITHFKRSKERQTENALISVHPLQPLFRLQNQAIRFKAFFFTFRAYAIDKYGQNEIKYKVIKTSKNNKHNKIFMDAVNSASNCKLESLRY